jgi:hypothetical protein
MKREIMNKLLDTLNRLCKQRPQINLDSEAARQLVAQAIFDEVFQSDVALTTYNDDQLELFSNLDT